MDNKEKIRKVVCPYCSRENCVPMIVYESVRCYGSKTHTARCQHCDGMLTVSAVREVHIKSIEKSDADEGDWD